MTAPSPRHPRRAVPILRRAVACYLGAAFTVLLAACTFGTRGPVQWNEKLVEQRYRQAGSHPPVIVVPVETATGDSRNLPDQIGRALEDAGMRVRWTAAGAGQSGTGFFISAHGHLLTAAHVVGAHDWLYAVIQGQSYPATVLALDEKLDLALLQLSGGTPAGVQPLSMAPPGSRVMGQELYTIGFPMTELLGEGHKLTKGIVSSDTGPEGDVNEFQLTAEIQPGSSGGPVLDGYGRVIGVVTATVNPFVTALTKGTLPQNVNFAVKAEQSVTILQQAQVPLAPPQTMHLATAATGVVKLKSQQSDDNTYVLAINGWDVGLVDVGSRELLMEYRSPWMGGNAVDNVIEAILSKPLFKNTLDAPSVRRHTAQRAQDQGVLEGARPELQACARWLPEDSRGSALIRLAITPSGLVRYPDLHASDNGGELVSRDAFEKARDCMAAALRKLRFSRSQDPRYYVEPVQKQDGRRR